MSQQLHCVELEAFVALNVQPPAFRKKPLTFVDDWLVMPLPEVVDVMPVVPRTPVINGPVGTVTVEVPPLGGSGHVSPNVVDVGVPLVVIVELTPVARPLNSCALAIWALIWENAARTIAALIQKWTTLTLPLLIVYSSNSVLKINYPCEILLATTIPIFCSNLFRAL